MAGEPRQRIDKWLFFARVMKSRTLSARFVQAGHVRVNRTKVADAAYPLKIGDVLTITLPRAVLVYRVLELGERRGPAAEARMLYADLARPTEGDADAS